MSAQLDAALLAAHARGDTATLVTLYQSAAAQTKNAEAAGFYLTHAYVFALELGHSDAPLLHAQLKAQGRET